MESQIEHFRNWLIEKRNKGFQRKQTFKQKCSNFLAYSDFLCKQAKTFHSTENL